MGCIPFCLCTNKFNAKKYNLIALVINGIKFALTIISCFLIVRDVFVIGFFSNFFEIAFTIANLIFMGFTLYYIYKGSAFAKLNNTSKILCILTLVFSGIILFIRILGLILGIYAYNQVENWISEMGAPKASTSDWLKLIIPFILYIIFEIMHFLAVNYLYKLIKLKTNVSYEEYLKNGQVVEQTSVTNTQINQNQQPVLITTSPQVSTK